MINSPAHRQHVDVDIEDLQRGPIKDNHILSSLLPLKSDNHTICTRNIKTEYYYPKTLISLTAILLSGYFTKTVINYFYILTHNSV